MNINKAYWLKMEHRPTSGYTRYATKLTTLDKEIIELLDAYFGKGQYASLLDRWEHIFSNDDFVYVYVSCKKGCKVEWEGWDTSECYSMMHYKVPFYKRNNDLSLE